MRLLAALLFLASLRLLALPVEDAKVLMDQKRAPEAIPLLQNWLASNPSDVTALLLLGNCQALQQEGNKAVETYEKALALAPDRVDLLCAYGGTCMLEAGKQTSVSLASRGRKALEKACFLDPKSLDAHEGLILFYSNAPWIAGGDMDKAFAHAKALRAAHPQRGLVQLIALYTKEKKFKEAFTLLDKVLTETPDDYLALYALGRLASVSGERLQDGLQALKRCLELEPPKAGPNHAGAHFRMGMILKKLGDQLAAEKCFDEALRLEGNNKLFADQVKKARQS